jgi:hypothetical protein
MESKTVDEEVAWVLIGLAFLAAIHLIGEIVRAVREEKPLTILLMKLTAWIGAIIMIFGGVELLGVWGQAATHPAVVIVPQMIFFSILVMGGLLVFVLSSGLAALINSQWRCLCEIKAGNAALNVVPPAATPLLGDPAFTHEEKSSPTGAAPSYIRSMESPTTSAPANKNPGTPYPADRCPKCGGKMTLIESLPTSTPQTGAWRERRKCGQCQTLFERTVDANGTELIPPSPAP